MKIQDGSSVMADAITSVIYGAPKTGKTTLALTAREAVLLDFDRGVKRAVNRAGKAVVVPTRWSDVAQVSAQDVAPYRTVIVDTVGGMIDMIIDDIQGASVSLTPRGWGQVATKFSDWLRRLRSHGKHVVLLAHTSEEQRGDDSVERIQASGKSKTLVFQISDIIGRLGYDARNRRILSFTPSHTAWTNGLGLEDQVIASPPREGQMADILSAAQDKINESCVIQQQAHDRAKTLREGLEMLDLDGMNEAVKAAKEEGATDADKRLMMQVAAEKGWTWDREQSQFVAEAEGEDHGNDG